MFCDVPLQSIHINQGLLLCRFRSMVSIHYKDYNHWCVKSASPPQAPMYYRRANAALIVFDITREKSFDEAKDWIKGMCVK